MGIRREDMQIRMDNKIMTKNEFKSVLELIHSKAIDNLRLYKYLAPVGFVVIGNDIQIMLLKFDSDESKHQSLEALKSHARKVKAKGVFVVSEAWMSKQTDSDNIIQPRNDPNKINVMVIGGVTPQMEGMLLQEFNVDNGKVSFGEAEITIGCENTSVNLLAGIFETTH